MWISLPVAVWTLQWSAEHDTGPAAPQRISLACRIGGAPKDYCQRVRRQIFRRPQGRRTWPHAPKVGFLMGPQTDAVGTKNHNSSFMASSCRSFSLERSRYFCEVARHWGAESSRSDFSQYPAICTLSSLSWISLGSRQIPHGGFKRLVVHPVLHRTHPQSPPKHPRRTGASAFQSFLPWRSLGMATSFQSSLNFTCLRMLRHATNAPCMDSISVCKKLPGKVRGVEAGILPLNYSRLFIRGYHCE